MNKKIRYAVVGLGHISQTAVLPAFKHAENSELAALVTGNPEKEQQLSDRYRVKAYTYDDLETALDKRMSMPFTSLRPTSSIANIPSAQPRPAFTYYARNRWRPHRKTAKR